MSDTKVTTLDDTPAVEAKPEPKTKKATAAEAKEAGISSNLKTITIHAGEGAAGREDVPVFVNGYGYQIKRGKPVQVPIEVVEVLKNAVTTIYEGGQAVDIPRFAFSIHD